MAGYVKYLTDLGFGDALKNHWFDLQDSDEFDIEEFGDIYQKNLVTMKAEFDDFFIVDCFVFYNTVLMRSNFCERLEQVKKAFGTDMWASLIQYEWAETGESSIFKLMNLEVGVFESRLASACETTRSAWVNAYGDGDL